MGLIREFRYRPEVDGLRAIAVLAVVFYHAGLGVRGGFIGVDVFFVISGFLITSLIIKDLQEGKFTMLHFWERRARRIIPALVVVVLATLTAGWFLLLPSDYAKLGKSACYQSVFAANVFFWRNTGYFAGPAEQMPLLHTWSLAVEEQFYLVVPLALSGLFCFPRLRRRGFLLALFALGILISLAGSIYGVAHHPRATFYLLPTRAWELLVGAFVALLPTAALGSRQRDVWCWLALGLILAPCFVYTKETPFPGLAALPPCLGTALFIWASGVTTGNRLPQVAQLLAKRPVVFIGLISYSLYLWHWPLFAFSAYWALEPQPLTYRLGLAAAAFPLAILSWKFVETPFRKRHWCATKRQILATAAAGLVLVFSVGFAIVQQAGIPARWPTEVIAIDNARNDVGFLNNLTVEDVRAGRLVPIGVNDPDLPVSVVVWGDSHAMAALPAFDIFLKEMGRVGKAATHSGVPPLVDVWWPNFLLSHRPQPAQFAEAVLKYVEQHKVHDVILIARWRYYGEEAGRDPDERSGWAGTTIDVPTALMRTIERLKSVGSQPWIMLDVPKQRFNVPRVLAQAAIRGHEYRSLLTRPSAFNGLYGTNTGLLASIRSAGARIIDPKLSFYDDDVGAYIVQKDGVVLYHDDNHLTASGAKLMLLPLIRTEFSFSSGAELFHTEPTGETLSVRDAAIGLKASAATVISRPGR